MKNIINSESIKGTCRVFGLGVLMLVSLLNSSMYLQAEVVNPGGDPYVTVASTAQVAAAANSTALMSVTSNASWTATTPQSWLSVSPSIATYGNATLTLTASANTGAERTAVVTLSATGVADQKITVTQKAMPVITSFTPDKVGSGSTVTIIGTYFTGTTAISIGGTSVKSFKVDSDTQISAIMGTEATGTITVTTPGGIATSASSLTWATGIVSTAGNLATTITNAGLDLATIKNLTITGTIDQRDFVTMRDEMPLLEVLDMSGATIMEYNTGYGAIYPANGIPGNAFTIGSVGKTSLTSVIMPSSLTSIGNGAFYDCKGLSGILTIPSGVITISSNAFTNCNKITGTLTLPSALKSIGNYAFDGCEGLTGALNIPTGVTEIGDNAFTNCVGLNGDLTLPSTITKIGKEAFYNCQNMTGELIIPPLLSIIENNTFYNCQKLSGSINIKSSVTSIGERAFYLCSGLDGTLTIPSTVTSIGNSAFAYCEQLTGTIALPTSLTIINNNIFRDCKKLTGSLAIPSGITTIGSTAFAGCIGLNGTLTIPTTVTTINQEAFSDCSGLTGDLTIPTSVKTLGDGAFSGCFGFNGSLSIPSSLTSISNNVFKNCTGLTGSLTIPSTVTSIGISAFSGCNNLTSVSIPSGVTSIGAYALSCSKLSTISVDQTTPIVFNNLDFVFYSVDKQNCLLSVPPDSNLGYATATLWSDFFSIITPTPTLLNTFSTGKGVASTPTEKITVGLSPSVSTDLVVTAPSGYEIRENGTSGAFGSSVTFTKVADVILSKTIEIRLAENAPLGTVSGDVVCTSGALTTKKMTVTGEVINLAPTDIALSATSINENVTANSEVGTLSSTDPNSANTFTYSLVTGDGNTNNPSFNISGSSLRITNSPDFETKSTYTVRVRTTDQGNLTFEKAFTITINDVNETPTDIALSASAINENVVANSTVGTLSSTDPDAANTFTYTLVAGTDDTDNAAFNISENNLRITTSPDFEAKNSYKVRVRSTDQGGLLYTEKAFTITINDVIGDAPTLTTQAVTNLGINTATGNGTITSLGIPNPTQYGVVWSTATNPTVALSTKTTIGVGATIGAFTSNMTSLTANTLYYVKAYATNNAGTNYGNEVTFTTSAFTLTSSSSTLSIGHSAGSKVGANVVSNTSWNISSNQSWLTVKVTIIVSAPEKVASVQEKVMTGDILYSYSGNKPIVLTASANPSTSTRTAYVTLSANGLSDRTITVTQEAGLAPTVTTQAVTAIDAFTATGNGTIEDLGCSNPTAHGVCWNTTGTPTITDSKVDIGTASATGAFTAPITGLSASKTYYVRAYATNGSETSYGDEVTFTTSGPAITFISSKNDFVQFSLALTANATFYVDWGDGTLVPKTGSTGELFYNTSSYVARNTVKIYGATIALFKANTQNLTNLVVNENTTLLALGCSSNQLTTLDVSKSTALETLWCNSNQLTTLDVSKNTALLVLDCNTNQLTTLDVTKNTKLTNFVCYSNQLSTLDVSKNTALVELSCSSNLLTALNTSQNAVLESLSCDNNKLTLLDVSKNNSLTGLSCDNNKLSLASLPQRKSDYGYYYYAPQAILAASASNGIVDLSSQLTANDIETNAQTTVYTWRTKTNGDDLILDTDYTLSNGVFTFLKTPADSIACYMSNAAFPEFKFSNALRTVYLKFTAGPAIVSTKTVTDITSITANVNAEITDFGIDKPTQHGVVWSTSTNPTVSLSTKTTEGKVSDVGTYTSEITGLKANTTYYVRAYATNSFDTSYGTEVSFTTSCGTETLPYSQGFNASTLPNCWNQQYVTGTTDLQFPDNEAPEGTNYVSINNQNSSSSYEETRLVSPAINTLAIKSVDVQFKWNYYDGFGFNDYVDVEYSTDGVNWNEVSKIYKFGVDDYGWTLKTIRLPQGALNKATIYVGFKFHATFWAELSMDDVQIIATTIKPEPTNQASNFAVGTVTTTGIPVTWTAADAGTQAPDGYLIKLNESAVVNPEDEVTPTDVTSVTNGEANIFVPSNGTDSSNAITGLTPGTMYNYSIFSYTNTGAIIDFNLTSAPSLYHATLPESVNGARFALTGATTANISWTLPATYNSANHSTLVFVKAANDINAGTPSNLLSSYEANSIFGLGTALQYDAAAHCVYKGDGTKVSITQLAANTSYYVIVYTVVDAVNSNGTNSYSASNSTSYKIAPSSQVTNFAKNVVGSTSISLKWTAATGSQAPDGYLIKLNTSNIDNPTNGTDPADVTSLTNNAANKKVISGTATSASSFSGLKAGTMYNYKIYSYTNSGTQINFNLNSAPVLSQATLPAKVSGQSYTLTGTTTANIVWTSAASYDKSKHSTLVFVKQASAINAETPTNAPTSYTASSVIGSGTAYQHDAAAYCVYKGDGNSVSITGLTENEAYYVSIYTVMDASNSDATNSYSKAATIANGTVPSNDIWATNGTVFKVLSDDVYTYICGSFSTVGGIERNNIARYNNVDGSLDNSWKPSVNNAVQTMALDGESIYIGGYFDEVDAAKRFGLAKISTTTGTLDANWIPILYGQIYSIATQGDDVYVGGGFNEINGVERTNMAKLNNSDGAVNANWKTNADNLVASIEIDGSDIYVGGKFSQIGGEVRNSIARINTTNGNADLTWDPNLDPSWVDGLVYTSTSNTTDIYVGGQFASIGGIERGNVAKISKLDGSLDTNWKPVVDGIVGSIIPDGADVYISGQFTSVDGEARNNIAKLNTGNAVIDAWNPNADGMVYSMCKVDDDFYVGGEFNNIDEKMQPYIAKVKAAIDYSLLYVTLSSVSVPIAAANNSKASVNVTSNTTWTANIDAAKTWLTANKTTVTGDAELIFTATENTSDSPRSAEVNITAVGKSTQTITVTQAACGLTLTTQAVTDIEAAKATGNGTITVLGTPKPTAHGVCWNTSGTPTITNSKVDKGAANSIGAFTASITGLTAGTTYYVRAYATSDGITTYGNEVNFTYLSSESTISTTISTSKSDIVVPDSKTLTIDNASKTINSITVNAGAKLTVNNLLTVSDVILKSDANNKSFNISNTVAEGSHSMSVSGKLKYVKTMDDTRWYFMSFPCNVKLSDIKQANGSPMGTLGTQWLIKYYDGESRIQNLGTVSNWKSLLITDSLIANKGYAFGLNYDTPTTMDVAFILDKNLVEHPESNKAIGTIAHGNGVIKNSNNVTVGETHKGWNLVGQPYLSKYQVSNTNVNLMLFVDDATGLTYSTIETFKGKVIDPFVAYFVQAGLALETSGITFVTTGRQSAPSAVAFDLSDRVQLNFTTATGTDYTNLKMDNNQSIDYQIGEDMEKWLGTGTVKPQVYTILGGVSYSYNALPMTSVVNLPLGFYTKTASNTTISVDATSAPSLSQLLLTDKTNGKVTNLLNSSYSFTATAGTNNTRFTITALRIPTETTVDNEVGCPTISINNSKLIINNLVGKTNVRVYDAVGRMLVSKTTSNSLLEIPMEVVGMYTVQMEVGAKSWVKKIVFSR